MGIFALFVIPLNPLFSGLFGTKCKQNAKDCQAARARV
jgi:hypothetical protein